MSTRFNFIGKLEVNTDPNAKGCSFRSGKTSNGAPYRSINMQIIQEKNNRAFVELFGAKQDKIKTMDTDNKKVEIAWNDRNDDDVVKSVASYKKTVVKIGDERKEFIAPLDAIDYIEENIDELKGKLVTVTGMCQKNVWKGKILDKYQISSIRTIDDEDTVKRLSITTDLFFTKNSFDTSDWNKEHKLYINGWTSEYMSDVKENRYVPQQILFDCSKIDFDNEKHRKLVDFRLKVLGCELDKDNKVVVKLKGKNVFKMAVICTYINGSEEVAFDTSMLTDLQREAIELGINKLEDFKPAGSVYGERVVVYKLRDFSMRQDSDYAEGCVDTEITFSEFEDKIYEVSAPETEDEVLNSGSDEDESEEDEDDLFG